MNELMTLLGQSVQPLDGITFFLCCGILTPCVPVYKINLRTRRSHFTLREPEHWRLPVTQGVVSKEVPK